MSVFDRSLLDAGFSAAGTGRLRALSFFTVAFPAVFTFLFALFAVVLLADFAVALTAYYPRVATWLIPHGSFVIEFFCVPIRDAAAFFYEAFQQGRGLPMHAAEFPLIFQDTVQNGFKADAIRVM